MYSLRVFYVAIGPTRILTRNCISCLVSGPSGYIACEFVVGGDSATGRFDWMLTNEKLRRMTFGLGAAREELCVIKMHRLI